MYVGTITRVNVDRGFGFIRLPGSPDVFLHASSLAAGMEFDEYLTERRVEFELTSDHRGLRALNVRPAN